MCSIYDTALYCGLANKLLIQYKAPTHTLSQRIPNCSTTIQIGSVSSIKCGHTPNFSVPNAYTCNRSRLNFSDKFQSSLVLTIRGHLQVIVILHDDTLSKKYTSIFNKLNETS
jgi:hypothetical protein